MKLYEVELSGDAHPPMDINWHGWTGADRATYDVPAGYDGFRFIGQGPDRTYILAGDSRSSPNATIHVGQGCPHVSFEGMSVEQPVGGKTKVIQAGTSMLWGGMTELQPFGVKMLGVDFIPNPRGPGTWGWFTYNAEIDAENVRTFLAESHEHNYAHGLNGKGLRVHRCEFHMGGQDVKVRNDPAEVLYAPDADIDITENEFLSWDGENAWRGGAGIVLEGPDARRIRIERNYFAGQENNGRCIAIDDAGGWGKPGDIFMAKNLVSGHGKDSYNVATIRVASNRHEEGSTVAKSLKIRRCASYGHGTKVEVGGIEGEYVVEKCNTPRLLALAQSKGVVGAESRIVDGGDFRPFSEGTG